MERKKETEIMTVYQQSYDLQSKRGTDSFVLFSETFFQHSYFCFIIIIQMNCIFVVLLHPDALAILLFMPIREREGERERERAPRGHVSLIPREFLSLKLHSKPLSHPEVSGVFRWSPGNVFTAASQTTTTSSLTHFRPHIVEVNVPC